MSIRWPTLCATACLSGIALLAPAFAEACSAVACLDRGIEMRRTFKVVVKHQGRPLKGVLVRISATRRTEAENVSSQAEVWVTETDPDGAVSVADLSPGDYWLQAEMLGITAAYHCFHVRERPSRKATARIVPDWGDMAPATTRVVGRLVDYQPISGGTPLMNLLRARPIPVSGASLQLRHPKSAATYAGITGGDGGFAIEGVPEGTYVLQISGGRAGEEDFDSASILLRVTPSATRSNLLISRRQAGAGSCGGTSLELVEQPSPKVQATEKTVQHNH